jgi:hypothetical protein
MQHGGLLSLIGDPEAMARIAERRRVAQRIAERTGVSLQDARDALDAFESDLSSKGLLLH